MQRYTWFWQRPLGVIVTSILLAVVALGVAFVPTVGNGPVAHASAASGDSTCHLNSAQGNIQHVIYIQFDNTHFTRDNPNVPSDLEQMPNLLNFMQQNGVLLDNHHTPLIAHTATDILTSLTGVYGDRHGVPISNSFKYYYNANKLNTGVSFAYWTDPLFDPSNPQPPTDTTYNMLTAQGMNAPAPWVPFTRAGCNVGSVATANTVLENIATDIPTVFGANSPEAAEVAANPVLATADFVGIGVHCAAGATTCASSDHARPDALPQEPGGYNGYQALFGNKYVQPAISPNGPMTDLSGNVIRDPSGNAGFPGFDGMSASVSLSYVAAMQEHGVPVTYAYISDAHDAHPNGPAYGPGEAGYVQALAAYNTAFGQFFTRLAQDGINKSNTLFVFTADEGDHFAGGTPSPANCDGVTIPCTYNRTPGSANIGEVNANLSGLLASEKGITTPFSVHADAAPNIYLKGNPSATDPTVRAFEQALGGITALNPLTGQTDNVTNYLADPTEMRILHMITADPARTPTMTMFADPNYFLFAAGTSCGVGCVAVEPAFAWNHGDVSPDINTTWLGMVGPGVKTLGVDGDVWSDHTDIRPTMMMLLGLQDDYAHDGRALYEIADTRAIPQSARAHRETLLRLAATYKQLDACVGQFGLASLKVATKALESTNNAFYTALEAQLTSLGASRDATAAQMIAMIEGATFSGQAINEQQAKLLTAKAQVLIFEMSLLSLI
ncbi:MAG: hypothetical protein ACHQ4H_10280 [Ktedonobacterales bacterium]